MASLAFSFSNTSFAAKYRKATESDAVVKNKLFPKKGKTEVNGPNFGLILNQSYITSLIAHAGVIHYTSEEWGFGVEGFFSSNSDKSERQCIEYFYNDPKEEVGPQCGPAEGLAGATVANYGPAYVPIREVDFAIAATAVWNPVYGKQLFFLSATGYFDLYLTMGAGIVSSKYFEEKTVLNNNNSARGQYSEPGTGGPVIGAAATELDSYGELGRPEALDTTNVMFTAGVGQKYHFAKRFSFKIELRNYTLLGTDSGFDLFFTLMTGIGFRL